MGAIQPARFLANSGDIRAGVSRIVPVVNPAAGANIVLTVPGGVMWRISAMTATLTTDAVVANRFPFVSVNVNGVQVWIAQDNAAVVASSGVIVSLSSDVPVYQPGGAGIRMTLPIPSAPLPQGTILTLGAVAEDIGDQWSAVGLWIEEFYFTNQVLSEIQREREQDERLLEEYELQRATTAGGN